MTDFTVGDTLHFLFTTRSFSTGAPTTLAGTPVLSAYEDASLTPITAGVSLGVDHNTVTGLNLATIVATGANGFETGKNYAIVITTGTVGGVSVVGEVVASFSLGRSAAAVDLANGTDGLGAIKSDTAATLLDTGTDGVVVATASKTGYQLSAAGVDDIWDEARSGHVAAGSFGEGVASVQGNVTGSVASVTGAVGSVTGSVGSVTGSVGSVTGAVGSVTAGVTVATNNDKSGYSISGTKTTLDALNDVSFANIWTATLTESYAADGAAPTPAQAIFAIQQFLQERATASTTVTVKKLDGSTTAMTFTLDDATTPTSITRAT